MKKKIQKPELKPSKKDLYVKAEKEKMDKLKLAKIHKRPKEHYRYACHGCTKVAFWASEPKAGVTIQCAECAMVQTTKLENYILDKK